MSLNGILKERITGFETKRESNDRKWRRGKKKMKEHCRKLFMTFIEVIMVLIGQACLTKEWLKRGKQSKRRENE